MTYDNLPSEKRLLASQRRLGRLWRVVYWAGRMCQLLGLLLLWWVLLLFPAIEDLRFFPYVGLTVAGAVFCVGWLAVHLAVRPTRDTGAIQRQKASSHGTNTDKEDTMFV